MASLTRRIEQRRSVREVKQMSADQRPGSRLKPIEMKRSQTRSLAL
jgi:hypothetical protein